MRVKHVPDPPDAPADGRERVVVERVRETQAAVPLVPGTEDDCCARLVRRTNLTARDDARTWLTFLRGLGFAKETERGFRRTRTEPTVERVRRGLLSGIVGTREIADVLRAGGDTDDTLCADPVDTDEAFGAVRETVPRWERTRTDDWENVWRDRTERLLGWFVAVGLAERVSPASDASDETATHTADETATHDASVDTELYRATTRLREVRA